MAYHAYFYVVVKVKCTSFSSHTPFFSIEHVRGAHSESCDTFCSINTCGLWYNYSVIYSINALWFVV